MTFVTQNNAHCVLSNLVYELLFCDKIWSTIPLLVVHASLFVYRSELRFTFSSEDRYVNRDTYIYISILYIYHTYLRRGVATHNLDRISDLKIEVVNSNE